jgi:TolB-like protein/Tfp pilus assembly protein PilF
MDADLPKAAEIASSAEARLDSWKEIAAHLNRHVTTVRRWEKHEGLPIHRHVHDKLGSVYAFPAELDTWWRSRGARLEPPRAHGTEVPAHPNGPSGMDSTAGRRILILGAALVLCCATLSIYVTVSGRRADAGPSAIRSIAVLPLENLSGDPADEYLSDGMTDALISRLAHFRTLRVASRTSSMAFKHSRRPLPEIARTLGVDAIVQGSVQRSAERIRVHIRLIDGLRDAHLWTRDYEREMKDLLGLQAELARAIGAEIPIHSTPPDRARMTSAETINPAAHQEYLIGRYHLWRDNEENLQRAIGHFERATQIDPQYAAAYASLAHAWWKRGLWGEAGLAATESPARAAAQKALHLDDTLPEAQVIQAELLRLYDRDLVRAETWIQRALALQPNNVDAHYSYGLLLMTVGRFDEAIAHMELAEQLDPLSPAIQSDLGRVLYRARRYDGAIRHLNRALELEPAMGRLVHIRLANVYEQMGQYDRALSALQRASDLGRTRPALRARVLARMGNKDDARLLLEQSEADSSEFHPSELAAAYVALGDKDRAFEYLFEMTARRDPGPNFVAVDPPFYALHSDRRWDQLLRQMNQPHGAQPQFP